MIGGTGPDATGREIAMSGVPIGGSTSTLRHHARTMFSAYALRVLLISLGAAGLIGVTRALPEGLVAAREQRSLLGRARSAGQ